MSYAIRIVGDAISDLRQLETSLQEEVLDELESIASAFQLVRIDAAGEAAHDFESQSNKQRQIVFMRLHFDANRQLVTLLAIAAVPRPPIA